MRLEDALAIRAFMQNKYDRDIPITSRDREWIADAESVIEQAAKRAMALSIASRIVVEPEPAMRFKIRDMAILARLPSTPDASVEGIAFHMMRLETIAPYVKNRVPVEIVEVDAERLLYKATTGGAVFFVSDEMLDPVTP